MKSQNENYVLLYKIDFSVDREKISQLGVTVSNELIAMMRKKKVMPD
jgi:hypothetical protein